MKSPAIVLKLAALALTAVTAIAAGPEPAMGPLNLDTPPLSAADAKVLKNPVKATAKSISRGRVLFMTSGCTSCHGNDGKAMVDVVANATDLTNPARYKNGTEEGQIFRDIRDGAGASMPAFKGQFTQEEDIWQLVNFVRSLWPADKRPAVEPEN